MSIGEAYVCGPVGLVGLLNFLDAKVSSTCFMCVPAIHNPDVKLTGHVLLSVHQKYNIHGPRTIR